MIQKRVERNFWVVFFFFGGGGGLLREGLETKQPFHGQSPLQQKTFSNSGAYVALSLLAVTFVAC